MAVSPSVFIVIINWNGWQDTLECLASLRELDYPNYEIIVVDNASSDGSKERIRENYPEVTLLGSEVNLGFAGGNNLGMRLALARRADYVWLLNNDTVVMPSALTELVKCMQAAPEAGMCGSKLIYYHDRSKVQALGGASYNRWFCIPKHLGHNSNANLEIDVKQVEAQLDYIIGASLLVSARFLKTVGLMSEDYFLYFEEIDWATRAKGRFSMAFAPSSIVYHKEGASIGGNINRPRERSVTSDFYWLRNRLVFTKKHYPYLLPTAYLSLLLALVNRLRRGQWDRAKMILGIFINMNARL